MASIVMIAANFVLRRFIDYVVGMACIVLYSSGICVMAYVVMPIYYVVVMVYYSSI